MYIKFVFDNLSESWSNLSHSKASKCYVELVLFSLSITATYHLILPYEYISKSRIVMMNI